MASKGKDKREVAAAKLEQAKKELGTLTDSLMKRYAIDDLIDERTRDFANEYKRGVKDIVRPFASARNADALAELSVARLAQLRRISIDDEGEFFKQELASVSAQLDKAFDYGNKEQRGRFFASLATYLKEGLGGRRSWLCIYERNVIEDFIYDTFAQEPEFALDVIELADWHLEKVESGTMTSKTEMLFEGDPDGGHAIVRDSNFDADIHASWSLTRMTAMATRGDSGDALCAFARENEILSYTETLNLIADAYEAEGLYRKAIALIRENAGAIDMIPQDAQYCWAMQLVNRMLDLGWGFYSKEELTELYCDVLLNKRYVTNEYWYDRDSRLDIERWYDELRGVAGESAWPDIRKKLHSQVPDYRKQIFLAHERSIREFSKRMIAYLGDEVPEHKQYEANSSKVGPLYPVTYYMKYAELLVPKANKLTDYREVATALACAARQCNNYQLAQKTAEEIASTYSRKKTLIKELQRAGFGV